MQQRLTRCERRWKRISDSATNVSNSVKQLNRVVCTTPTADDEQPAPLTQKEYLKQLQARLEAKKAATRDKVRQVKAAMDKASEYVAPLGQGQRLALFERVSEEWLKDDDGGMQTDVGEKARVAAVDDGVSSVVVEESKEAVLDGDVDDGSVVIGAAEEQDAQDMEAAGHAEFAKAREEWLQSLQQPTAAATFHSPSRPSTASSSTTTSAVSSTATVRLSSLTSSTSSASLLAGSHFDESASAASFQEARQAWLQSLTAKPRTTTTPNATSPTLAPQTSPSITERVSCYQCYRLFAMGAGKAGGESGRELCGVECVGGVGESGEAATRASTVDASHGTAHTGTAARAAAAGSTATAADDRGDRSGGRGGRQQGEDPSECCNYCRWAGGSASVGAADCSGRCGCGYRWSCQ